MNAAPNPYLESRIGQVPGHCAAMPWESYFIDAWNKESATKIGYEISFNRHFYKLQPLRTLEEISADLGLVEQETEAILDKLSPVQHAFAMRA